MSANLKNAIKKSEEFLKTASNSRAINRSYYLKKAQYHADSAISYAKTRKELKKVEALLTKIDNMNN